MTINLFALVCTWPLSDLFGLPFLRHPLLMHLGIDDTFLERVKVKLPVHMVEFELMRQFTVAVPLA